MPSDAWLVRHFSYGLDWGSEWQTHTLIKPYEYQRLMTPDSAGKGIWVIQDRLAYSQRVRSLKGMHVTFWPGIISQWKTGKADTDGSDFRAMTLFGQVEFRQWYANIYVRTATRPDAFLNFTPYDRPISRAGMHAGEIDQALIGYSNSWIHVSFGRGRQIWGPFLWDNAVLSESSASYDHLAVHFMHGRFTAAFFTGFLEGIQDSEGLNQIRYISGRALQYRFYQKGLLSAGETTVYYGCNRPLDLGFSNPLIPHVENEQNQRENVPDGNQSNAIWFINMDCFLPAAIRVSGSVVFDEFQLDKADRDQGRPDAMAFQFRAAKSWVGPRSAITVFGRYDSAGPYTYRHESPYACFASRSLPLALPQGSDFYQYTSGLRWITPYRICVETQVAYRKQGENDLKKNMYVPYTEFTTIPFPSGSVITFQYFCASVQWAVRSFCDLKAGTVIQRTISDKNDLKQVSYYLRFQYHLPVEITR